MSRNRRCSCLNAEHYWQAIGSGFLVLALSLMAGCAASNRTDKKTPFSEINIPPHTSLHAAQSQPESLSDTQADRLHPGDTIQSHFEAPSKWKLVIRSPGTNQPTIRSRDKCNPLWWFGNIDEPVAPNWYRPGKAGRNFRYHLRNPCHNFFCYVIGISDKTFRRAGKYPNDNFSPHGGWNVAASNYKYPCLWLPFISYQHRGFQFYIGWRNGGNFGIKLRYSKPTS
jgi:hypothetical protein